MFRSPCYFADLNIIKYNMIQDEVLPTLEKMNNLKCPAGFKIPVDLRQEDYKRSNVVLMIAQFCVMSIN